jgi:hypothetical protein
MTSRSSRRLGYEALGFAVWQAARWYVRRKFGAWPRRILVVVLVGAGVGAAAVRSRS